MNSDSGSLPPGDSREQRRAQDLIIAEVGQRCGAVLAPRTIALPTGARVELNGFSADPLVLCEAWAHIGPAKSAQKNKVMADALKLVTARATFPSPEHCRAILAFCDEQAAQHLKGKSWMGAALSDLAIEIMVVELPPSAREAVVAAQVRQYR